MMNYYPKKSLWKWILLYVLIGAVVYGAVYYFFFYQKGGHQQYQDYQSQTSNASSEGVIQQQQAGQASTTGQPASTADWKTYRDTDHGFSVQYPDSVTFNHNPLPNGQWQLSFYEKDTSGPVFSVNVAKSTDVKYQDSQVMGAVTVGGIVGKRIKLNLPSGDTCYESIIVIGQVTYIFDDNCQNDERLFNQVLSTFKFTK